jgi:hypothetical protein
VAARRGCAAWLRGVAARRARRVNGAIASLPGLVSACILGCNRTLTTSYEYPCDQTIDTTRQIAETLLFSLTGVDVMQGKGLKAVSDFFFLRLQTSNLGGVDFPPQTRCV